MQPSCTTSLSRAVAMYAQRFAVAKEYVVIGFGLFFVFREKQLPEYKLRNFKKTAQKPISAARRLSSISSKASSTQVLCNHYPLTNKNTREQSCLYYYTIGLGRSRRELQHDMDPCTYDLRIIYAYSDNFIRSLLSSSAKTRSWKRPTTISRQDGSRCSVQTVPCTITTRSRGSPRNVILMNTVVLWTYLPLQQDRAPLIKYESYCFMCIIQYYIFWPRLWSMGY